MVVVSSRFVMHKVSNVFSLYQSFVRSLRLLYLNLSHFSDLSVWVRADIHGSNHTTECLSYNSSTTPAASQSRYSSCYLDL